MSALIPRIRKLAAVFAVVIVSTGVTATAAPATAGRTPAPAVMAARHNLADCTVGTDCVGDLNDYAAMTPAGDLTSVKGSFANFTPGTTETGQGYQGNAPDMFSLQLN